MKKSVTLKKQVGKKSVSKSRSKLVELAALSAVGLTLGRDALADGVPESGLIDASAEVVADEAPVDVSSELASDDVSIESSDSQLAIEVEGADQLALLADGESVQYADASDVLGVRSGESVQYAQASTGTSAAATKTGAAKDAGASTAGAADVAADVAASAGAGAVGAEAVVAVGVGAVALGAMGAAGAAAGAAAGGGGAGVGFAAKGILSGSTVFYDFDGSGTLNSGDPSGLTAVNGSYSISLTAAQKLIVESGKNSLGQPLKLVVTGGTDTTTGNPFTGTLSSVAPTDLAVEGKVTVYSTMMASGMTKAQIIELTNKDPDNLSASDFDGASDPSELIATKLFALVQARLDIFEAAHPEYDGDADLASAGFNALSNFLEQMTEDGDLGTLLANFTVAQLDDITNPVIDKALSLFGEGKSASEIDAIMDAFANELDASGTFAAIADGDISAGDLIAIAADMVDAEAAADAMEVDVAATDADLSAIAEKYGATIRYSAGAATALVFNEDDVEALLGIGDAIDMGAYGSLDLILQVDGTLLGGVANPISGLANLGIEQLENVALDGTVSNISSVTMSEADALYAVSQGLTNADFFDGAGGVNIVLQVEGTLLGTAANPLTFAQLAALGVDGINDGTGQGGTYLHLTADNFTHTGAEDTYIDSLPDIGGALHIYVDGTHLDPQAHSAADLSHLGATHVADHSGSGLSDWDDVTYLHTGT